MSSRFDAIVVGAGPNGLAAAITLARKNLKVLLLEAKAEIGGGLRSAELTLPGFVHDVCASIFPLVLASRFFQSLPLDKLGVEWIQPEFPLVHPLDDGAAVTLRRSVTATAEVLGSDGGSYQKLMSSFVSNWKDLIAEILQPMLHVPRHPILLGRFGVFAMRSADSLSQRLFKTAKAQALFAGLAGHSFLPLRQNCSAAVGLVLAILAHAVGWPMVCGGAGKLARALATYFEQLGGKIETSHQVASIDELGGARVILFDVSPTQLLSLAGHRLPERYCEALKNFRHGPGAFKVDYALAAPIPWRNADCARAGTLHLGGTLEEIEVSERIAANGGFPERPFVLLAQPSLFDNTRAPAGKHTAWVYCHVPHGAAFDMTQRIENQIERFAPGFRDCILERHVRNPRTLEADNPNLIGGDINGGLADFRQMIARPVLSPAPYRTPVKGLFLCSASTPPGGGVHGMCGYHAAQQALKFLG